jgi:hypothetical protein
MKTILRKQILYIALITTMIIVAGCSVINAPTNDFNNSSNADNFTEQETGKVTSYEDKLPKSSSLPQSSNLVSELELTRTDDQGAVVVTVTPLNLDQSDDLLVFDISLNTHSVDLSMDLAQFSILETDLGSSIQAIKWDGPQGGHHVEGKLTFSRTIDGKNIFDGARSIKLKISEVDAPLRIFSWRINE